MFVNLLQNAVLITAAGRNRLLYKVHVLKSFRGVNVDADQQRIDLPRAAAAVLRRRALNGSIKTIPTE